MGVFLEPTRALRAARDKFTRYCVKDPDDKGLVRHMERRQPGDPIRRKRG